MTRVLILSTTTGYQLRSFGEAAERAGIDLIFATDRCHRLDDPWRDAAVPVRFHEEDASLQAIVDAARARPIDGVLAVGDRPVVLAARAARALGLPGNPPDAAAASANKRLARAALGCGRPAGAVVLRRAARRRGDPRRTIARVRFPCVVKPLGLSGSRGVMRANSPAELDAAARAARALLSRKDVRAMRSGLERHDPDRRVHRGARVRRRGRADAGRASGPSPSSTSRIRSTVRSSRRRSTSRPRRCRPRTQQAVLDHVQRAAARAGSDRRPGSRGVPGQPGRRVRARSRRAADRRALLEGAAVRRCERRRAARRGPAATRDGSRHLALRARAAGRRA